MNVVGYIGTKTEGKGSVQVCHECSTTSLQELNAHSYAPVYDTDTYLTHTGGMTCNVCQIKFI